MAQFTLLFSILFPIAIFLIVVTRLVLVLRLYAIKDGKIFDKTVEGEIFGFMASMTLPFRINQDPNDDRTIGIIRTLNRLKDVYWSLMILLVLFLIMLYLFN